ncbi:hypothetical protein [Deinococcus humi]|uniref:Uncharacterized protein n=1 Tax=Deinococcus humi TaxID=662880 RepID=A0A7W8JVD9_9DEIO|nr:hypothetical protein [Deinococcus humi]MBB5363640.1 hypothetical protein [Deinococcus humi]
MSAKDLETNSGRRSFFQVWSDASGWRATVQYGNEAPRTFHEPDDALLFLYSCLLGRQETAPSGASPWGDPDFH